MFTHDRLPVTDLGVVIPKVWFGDAAEVELRSVDGEIIVVPVRENQRNVEPYSEDDPIWQFGKNPIELDVTDGSINHDKYIYDNSHGLDR